MATSPVPMFDPTGTVRMIQPDQVDAATQAGGMPAVRMIDPEGTPRYVRQDQVDDALANNGKIAPPPPPPGPPPSLLERELGFVQNLPGIQMATGAMKGIEKTAAGALENVAGNLAPQTPVANQPGPAISEAARQTVAAPVSRGLLATAKWLRQNTDTQGWEKVGDVGQLIAQLVYAPELAEGELAPDASRAFTYAQSLLQDAKRAKWFEENPAIAKLLHIGLQTARGSAEMGGQTYVTSGGNAPETKTALESGAIGGGAGGLVTEAGGAALRALGRQATELMPSIENLGSGDYRVLRSEAEGPQGQSIATPLQKEAANIASQPGIRAERVAALQQMPGSIARTGLENALTESEAARMTGPFSSEPPIAQPNVANAWDHTTPDGRSLNPDEAREELANIRSQWLSEDNDPAIEQQLEQQYGDLKNKLNLHDRFQETAPPTGPGTLSPADARDALDNLKTRWLAEDWGPQQDAQFKQVYNQLQQQVDRHDSYMMNRTMTQPFDIKNALANTNSLDDAAGHLDLAARQRLQYLTPDLQRQYQMLNASRTRLQDAFDKAAGTPLEQARILPQIADANKQLESFFQQDGVRGVLPPSEAQQALVDLRRANGFKALDNAFNRHLSLQPSTAAAIGQPSVPTGSLANDIEKIKNQYGDVLDPVLGNDGLNHAIKLGQQVNTPEGADAVTSLIGHIGAAYKRHFINIGGLVGAAGIGTLYHIMGDLGLGAAPAALAASSAAGARKYVIQRLATDPEFNRAVRYSVQQGIPPRVAGAILAARLGLSRLVAPLITRTAPATGDANATSP
jgi:hypothetical protein